MNWQDIKTAPTDGTIFDFITVINGNVVLQGTCMWGELTLMDTSYHTWVDPVRKVVVAPTHWLLRANVEIRDKPEVKLNFYWDDFNNDASFVQLIVGRTYFGFILKSNDKDNFGKYISYINIDPVIGRSTPNSYDSLDEAKLVIETYLTEWTESLLI